MQTKPALAKTDLHVGVDGCAGGWFAVAGRGNAIEGMALCDSFAEVLERFPCAARLLVDMPVGLSNGQRRHCDIAARLQLPPGRRSCVFPVPVREAVYAADYTRACDVNFAQTGKRLSRQSWNICPKIREVDGVLRRSGDLAERVLESHPELCFAKLAGAQVTLAGKKTDRGQQQRLGLLSQRWSAAQGLYQRALSEHRRFQLARDDILDAMVLAVVASGPLVGVCEHDARDPLGLPMQIWYPG